jgi:hypothetical protein
LNDELFFSARFLSRRLLERAHQPRIVSRLCELLVITASLTTMALLIRAAYAMSLVGFTAG